MLKLLRERPPGQPRPRVISFDEIWTHRKARRRGKRREVCLWTVIVEGADGQRWGDFEAGNRSNAPLLRRYGRLPEGEEHPTDAYRVYDWLPANRRQVGKRGVVNRNEGCNRNCGTS